MASQDAQLPETLRFLRERYVGEDPARREALEEARAAADVAQQIHDLRVAAGLTQRELADRVGTTQSVISRLEGADYEGHSLAMVRRVAAALNYRVRLQYVPIEEGGPIEGTRENDAPRPIGTTPEG